MVWWRAGPSAARPWPARTRPCTPTSREVRLRGRAHDPARAGAASTCAPAPRSPAAGAHFVDAVVRRATFMPPVTRTGSVVLRHREESSNGIISSMSVPARDVAVRKTSQGPRSRSWWRSPRSLNATGILPWAAAPASPPARRAGQPEARPRGGPLRPSTNDACAWLLRSQGEDGIDGRSRGAPAGTTPPARPRSARCAEPAKHMDRWARTPEQQARHQADRAQGAHQPRQRPTTTDVEALARAACAGRCRDRRPGPCGSRSRACCWLTE